ncbi:hypothetical protein HBA91_11865 [Ochrobactrum sp. MR34]|nr:hypothetical protein [Ochrobactrum sp. MR34]
MHSQRSVPDGIAANPTDADVKIAQRQIQSVEDQAALLARAMQKMHGGRWGYAYDEDVAAVFIFQRFD